MTNSQVWKFLPHQVARFDAVSPKIGFVIAAGGEFPSQYWMGGPAPPGNPTGATWSVLEDIYQIPNPPPWNAIVAFNH
jgi:hypothetical protein